MTAPETDHATDHATETATVTATETATETETATATGETRRPHVVVVGAGFAGLSVARGLYEVDVDLTVIDRTNHHLFQPLLYQVSTALLAAGDIAVPVRQVLAGDPRARTVLAEVTGLDPERRLVSYRTDDGTRADLHYDHLVVAAGACVNYFGHDEWARLAPGMKTLDDALLQRDRILRALEIAATTDDPQTRREWLTFVIVGAGPTGVELAGQIAVLARSTLADQFTTLDPGDVDIVVADAGDVVLAPFHPRLQAHTRHSLEALGVRLLLGHQAEDVDAGGVTLRRVGHAPGRQEGAEAGSDGAARIRVTARTVIWAAGVRPSPLAQQLADATNAQLDHKGRLRVQPDCTVPGHPEVFAIGDMVDLDDLPGLAEPAIQAGRYVARVIRARVDRRPPPGPFRYLDLGIMATIAPFDAVAQRGRIRVAGLPAKIAWSCVHVAFLVGWGSRAAVLASWAWTLLTHRRRHRVIVGIPAGG